MSLDRTKLHSLISMERTLVALKPDAIQRQLMGELISRFEKRGLKMLGCKLLVRTAEQVGKQYPDTQEWLVATGSKTIQGYEKRGMTINKNPREIGEEVRKKLINDSAGKPFLAMVWEGPHAVALARKTIGATNPLEADVGTIRGDYTVESYFVADSLGHSVRNLVHASGTVDEAKDEIGLYFKEDELVAYDFTLEEILYGD